MRLRAIVACVTLFLCGCAWLRSAVGPGRERCQYVEGGEECRAAPQEYTCDCDGEVLLATYEERQEVQCGDVITWCHGTVRSYQPLIAAPQRVTTE